MALAKRDLSGERFGRWVVIKKAGPYIHNGRRKDWLYLCKCDCGEEREVKSSALSRGISQSCGCLAADINSEIHIHSLVGQDFGDWVVIARGRSRNTPKDQTKTYWLCKCKHCNHTKDIYAGNLSSGKSKQCPCQRIEKAEQNISSFWKGMLKTYRDGAKKRNLSFELSEEEFRDLMLKDCIYCGSKPSPKRVSKRLHCAVPINGIDRVDPNKGYIVDNCVPCCSTCNKMKLNHSLEGFLLHIEAILKFYGSKPKQMLGEV